MSTELAKPKIVGVPIARSFIFDGSIPDNEVVKQFIAAALEFAGITDLYAPSQQQALKAIVRAASERDYSNSGISHLNTFRFICEHGYQRTPDPKHTVGYLNVNTLMAIAHACKLNMDIVIAANETNSVLIGKATLDLKGMGGYGKAFHGLFIESRELRGYDSYAALARAVGVSGSAIRLREKGFNYPRLASVLQHARTTAINGTVSLVLRRPEVKPRGTERAPAV